MFPPLYEKNWDLSFLTYFIETFKMYMQNAVKMLYFQLSLCLVKPEKFHSHLNIFNMMGVW